MTSKQIKIMAIVLLALAALLALMAWQVGRKPHEPAAPVQAVAARHPVVVTAKAIEAGKPVPADALKVEMLPIEPADSYAEVGKVAGKVPLVALGANVPVLASHLLRGLAAQVLQGERAVAINVDEMVGVGNQVQPGDFVDVFLVLRRDNQEVDGSQARLLLSRLRVLAYGASTVTQTAQPQEQMMVRQEGAKTAVLAVPVEQVNKLAIGQQAGRLLLALRNPKDETTPDAGLFAEPPPVLKAKGKAGEDGLAPADRAAAGLALSGLVGASAPHAAARPLPAAVPRPPRSAAAPSGVEVIRAGKRDIE
ncbi:Flp pilus assembly protein CpaB [Cupriavidus sp. USMAA2-4]|uniref:Flp pilus assembly protein CpaB n=1 Tax=Cupriavidus malaysiensis TaxID=367825 RepID=A0ABN4TM80_9BURK|nr:MULTISPECIES: Flp pilus assembly protein CpaB [Cupriavidus]AOY95279.1 Flp pilus assembly protein CpaB [Cupriavidus sp. USMAA2-4]AOZ08443.1 Flp pilus assembly protein CpaB [Cupriavidus malaysiensis]